MERAEFTGKSNRLFTAIVPDRTFFESFRPLLESLKNLNWPGRVRWTPLENLHLTVRFLGDTDHERFLRFRDALRASSATWKELDLVLSHPVFLPKASKARVIALGFRPSPELSSLADSVERAAVSCGFEPEKRPFMAHMTLGRCDVLDLRDFQTVTDLEGPSFSVRSMELVKSSLTKTGAVYGVLETLKLMPGH